MVEVTFEKIREFEEMPALIKIDTLIIANLFIWTSPFIKERDLLIDVSNYAMIKFASCDSSLREILYSLIRKIMMA